MKSATPIVIHIPHASRRIPHDIRGAILLSDSELEEGTLGDVVDSVDLSAKQLTNQMIDKNLAKLTQLWSLLDVLKFKGFEKRGGRVYLLDKD